ncbi:monocarboxylate transporter 12-like [Asterias rubens]|uniref:monocarboxylate transporter 12-like n=1 Tax=Asterias rubens TaxID=7604 RepID=UPI00145560E1|nr:monocarboxylate transporter 12-like [Asterias rubens]
MKSGCLERVLHFLTETLQDGGLHGWIAVLGLFTSKVAWCNLVKGLGMMLPTLQEQFDTSTWLIGWMVAFVHAGTLFSGVLATPLKERFGARTVVTVSGLVAGISMITASFLSSLYVITFILTVFTGSAVGISYVISKHLIGCCFNKSVTTAYGMAGLGSSATFLAVVPLIQLFLDTYGWSGTMLLLGALSLHLAVFGALMKPPAASGSQDGYEAALTDEEQETREDKVAPSNRFGCSCFTKVYSFARDTFQLGLFSSLSFWLVLFLYIMMDITHSAWIIYYVQYTTVSKGFILEDAAHFVVAFGLGTTISSIVIGPLFQAVQVVSAYVWLAAYLLLCAIYYAVDPWLTSYWPIVANTFVYGSALSIAFILIDVVNKKIFGKERLGHAVGLFGLSTGVTSLLLLYFPGLMYDLTGDHTVVFSLMAAIQSLNVVAALGLGWRQTRHPSSPNSTQ